MIFQSFVLDQEFDFMFRDVYNVCIPVVVARQAYILENLYTHPKTHPNNNNHKTWIKVSCLTHAVTKEFYTHISPKIKFKGLAHKNNGTYFIIRYYYTVPSN